MDSTPHQKRKPIIVGNWKLNKTRQQAIDLAIGIRNILASVPHLDVGIAPPFTALSAVSQRIQESRLILAAQNCIDVDWGAYTGEVSVPMLADAGCSHIIVGHSERRQFFAETDAVVNRKVRAILKHGLIPILCIGEHLEERQAGKAFEIVETQLLGGLETVSAEQASKIVLAYEPVWAIGTGHVATPEQAQEVHGFLRKVLVNRFGGDMANQIRIQYGGSVKPDNIRGLMEQPDIDGALVGGASLDAESFIKILKFER